VVALAWAEGDAVVATVRRPHALSELAQTYGERLVVEPLDVTDREPVTRVMAHCLARERIDSVVNKAGGGLIGATEEMTDAQVQAPLALNLLAPRPITRALLTPMRAQGGGRIMQRASVGGHIALPLSRPYHAATWGREGFPEAVRQEVAACGVDLTIVEPGGMRPNFQAGLYWTTETPVSREATVGQGRRWIEGADDRV
jgi:NADP-dependent 3-hydroxy acid dehydrogenase YdfG